jgi:hypothetical protein
MVMAFDYGGSGINNNCNEQLNYLDSPSTTSSTTITFKTQIALGTNGGNGMW